MKLTHTLLNYFISSSALQQNLYSALKREDNCISKVRKEVNLSFGSEIMLKS